MNFEELEKNIIFKYWRTLPRKTLSNIITSRFMKKPYIEKYIIEMAPFLNDDILTVKIQEYIDSNKITTEEIILFINNIIELENGEKKTLSKIFLNNPFYDDDINKVSINIILYQIKYFRIYQMIHELIFDNKEESDEHYYFVLLFINNKSSDLKRYIGKNINFHIFYYYLHELYKTFHDIIEFMQEKDIFKNIPTTENDIFNLYLKNMFNNWYSIYKNDILEKRVNDKIGKYMLRSGFLSKILCFPVD
jgi:hypothetical protein